MVGELYAPFDAYFEQYLIILFLIAFSGDIIKSLKPDCDKSALHMIRQLNVLSVDKHKVLCVFNEIFSRLQIKFRPDARLISSIIGQISDVDLV